MAGIGEGVRFRLIQVCKTLNMQAMDFITGSSLPFELGILISKRLAYNSPLNGLELQT